MSEPKHIISRYTFEVEVGAKERAHNIQNQLSQLFSNRISRLLDKILTEYSVPGYTFRIDKLELDLGEFEDYRLDIEMPERLEKMLRKKLADLIHFEKMKIEVRGDKLTKIPEAKTKLEALAYFLEYGRISFWTDTQNFAPEELILNLLKDAPSQLIAMFKKLGRDPVVMTRLTYQFSEQVFEQLYAVTAPTHQLHIQSYSKNITDVLVDIEDIGYSRTELAQEVQEAILYYLLVEKSLVFDKKSFEKSVQSRLARKLDLTSDNFDASEQVR